MGACALLLSAASASAATFAVINGDDTGAGSLRQAITNAETNGNDPTVDQIVIGFAGNIDLLSGLPQITTPMTITGPGVNALDVRRSPAALPANQFRLFSVIPAAGDTDTIQNLTISGARATGFAGGALAKSDLGNLIIDSVLLIDNRSDQGGGVFYNEGSVTIRNSTLSLNQSPFGGGILGRSSLSSEPLGQLINTTLSGNSSTGNGGGIDLIEKARILVNSSTIAGNTADSDDNASGSGGGIFNNSTGTAPVFSLANTILANNVIGTASPVANQCNGAFVSDDYNLRGTADGGCTGFTGVNDLVDSSPLLGALGINAVGPPTIALLPGSPAINAGNPATPADGAYPVCPSTDERSLPRGAGGNRCDIGAFEVQRNATTAAVACAPSSLTLGTGSTACTATVTDTGSGPTTPTGTVSFTSNNAGTFSAGGACTLAMPSGSSASCQITYTPTTAGSGSHQITGAYGGDIDHDASQGAAQVGVLSPPGTNPPTSPSSHRAAAIKRCKKKFPKGPKRKKCIKRARKRFPA